MGLLCFAMLAPIAVVVAIPHVRERMDAPDRAKMRAYRLSKVDDKKLVQLHEEANRLFEGSKQAAAEDGRKFWQQRDEERRACEANLAAKLRDPYHCNRPLPVEWPSIGRPLPGLDSPEAFFEDSIIGPCRFASSIYEAKQMGCLPP